MRFNALGNWSLPQPSSGDIYTAALVKGNERYIFLYDQSGIQEALCTLGRWAADQSLSINWYDAAVLAQKIRQHKNHLESQP